MDISITSIFVCVASIVVLVYPIKYDAKSMEMPVNVRAIIIWATVKVNVAIVSVRLLMLRPTYLLVLRRSPTKNSSTGSRYNPVSEATSHKLVTLTAHNEVVKSLSDSTQLAETGHPLSVSSNSSYEAHGNTTIVVGPVEERGRDYSPEGERRAWGGDMGGIVVTNDMSVRVDKVV